MDNSLVGGNSMKNKKPFIPRKNLTGLRFRPIITDHVSLVHYIEPTPEQVELLRKTSETINKIKKAHGQ